MPAPLNPALSFAEFDQLLVPDHLAGVLVEGDDVTIRAPHVHPAITNRQTARVGEERS